MLPHIFRIPLLILIALYSWLLIKLSYLYFKTKIPSKRDLLVIGVAIFLIA